MNTVIFAALGVLLVTASVLDAQTQKIPNWLTVPFIIGPVLGFGLIDGTAGILFSIKGLGLGLGLLLIPWLMGGMGAGDVKLMAAVGALTGAERVFWAFACTAILGGVYALGALLVDKRRRRNLVAKLKTLFLAGEVISIPSEKDQPVQKIPYGVAIAVGTFSSLILEAAGYTVRLSV